MGTSFTELERIKIAAKALAAGVKDADPSTQWYESANPNAFVLPGDKVWLQANILRQHPAANITEARAKVAGPLAGILLDYSQPGDAKRLTAVPGVNNTYAVFNIPGDPSSGILDNWLLPQLIRQANGLPSFGYAIRLYNGDPAGAGVEILTTAGAEGTGINKSVAWIFDYANGLLLSASGFAIADPYIVGFVYNGTTAESLVVPPGTEWQEDVYAATAGQISFLLTAPVGDVESFEFTVNGVDYYEAAGDFIRSGQTITWQNVAFVMEVDDRVVIKYRRA